ncbi:MAG: M56 family metallopeptidase [Gemmataceae bacterium]
MSSLLHIGLSNAVAAVILTALVLLIALFCRRPAVLHALWLLVLIKLVTPPLLIIPIPWAAVTPQAASESLSDLDEEPPLLALLSETNKEDQADLPEMPLVENSPVLMSAPDEDTPFDWQGTLLGVWLVGTLAWVSLAGTRLWRFGRNLRLSRPAPQTLTHRVNQLCAQVGLASPPGVYLVPARLSPMVWGFTAPALLLPEGLEEKIGMEALDTLLLHELAHLRRGDHWVRWIEFVTLALFWWFPIAWLARRELRETEEQCCDAWVVRTLPSARKVYASAIVDTLEFLDAAVPSLPPLASGLGEVSDLKRRLTMILRDSISPRLGGPALLAVFGLALCLLPLVPRLSQAQEPPKKDIEAIEREIQRRKMELEELSRKLHKLANTRATAAELEEAGARKRAEEGQKKAKDARVLSHRDIHVMVNRGSPDTIRIEISGVEVKPEEAKALKERIEGLFPGKTPKVTVTRGQDSKIYLYRNKAGLAFEAEIGNIPGLGAVPNVVVVPTTPGAPLPPKVPAPILLPGQVESSKRFPMVGQGDASKRIDKLEKNIDLIMKELEALRKDLKSKNPRPE